MPIIMIMFVFLLLYMATTAKNGWRDSEFNINSQK